MWTLTVDYLVAYPVVYVWSELCGMWTRNKARIVVEKSNGLIWTMWDVNFILGSNAQGQLVTFDLNYVGCERERKVFPSLFTSVWSELCGMWTRVWDEHWVAREVFDLNYVGCERVWWIKCMYCSYWFDLNYVGCELQKTTQILRRNVCLIWTMWDVNRSQIEPSVRSSAFDLNYVGCEQSILGIISKRISVWSELCGMWTLRSPRLCPSSIAFDLNYVGCEQGKQGFNSVPSSVWSELCGMWTLRDVLGH